VAVDQPPLHAVLRAEVLAGPGGQGAAGQASVRGRVRVRLLIRADGVVDSAEVVVSSGDAELDEAARRGLLRWRFAPARRDGEAIDAYLLLWVTFSE
jgi:protein TonB